MRDIGLIALDNEPQHDAQDGIFIYRWTHEQFRRAVENAEIRFSGEGSDEEVDHQLSDRLHFV